MWDFMENHAQSVFVQSYDEGIARYSLINKIIIPI